MAATIQDLLKKIKKTADEWNPLADNDPRQAGRQNAWTTKVPQKITQTIQRNPVADYFNPRVSGQKGFWSPQNKIATTMAGTTQLPKIKFKPMTQQQISNPVLRFGANTAMSVGEDLANTPRNLLQAPINVARDYNTGQRGFKTYAGDIAPFAEGLLNIGTHGS